MLKQMITPEREEDQKAYTSRRTRRIAGCIFPLAGRRRSPLHHYFSEYFDWDDPPLFRNFLPIDVSEDELCIRRFAATGYGKHEENPPVEDEIKINLKPTEAG